MISFKPLADRGDAVAFGEGDGQGGVRAFHAQAQLETGFHAVGVGALVDDGGPGGLRELAGAPDRRLQPVIVQCNLKRGFPRRLDLRQADAIGGEDAAEGVDQHGFHGQRLGHAADDLTGRAAKSGQRIVRGLHALRQRDVLDRLRHILHGDGEEALGGRFRPVCFHLRGKARQRLAGGLGVERLVLVRAEDVGEEARLDPAQRRVGVGDGRRAAAAIGGGAGVRAGAFRAGQRAALVIGQDGPAAGGHGVHRHHRRANGVSLDIGLEAAVECFPVKARHVGGCAAHIEADHLGVTGALGRHRHADHAPGRAGEQGVAAPECFGGGKPPGGGEEV